MFKPARLISASSVPMNSARSSIVIETNPSRIVALSSLASSSDHFTPSSIVFLPIGLACIFLMFLAIFLFHPVCSELGRDCIILVLSALTHCFKRRHHPRQTRIEFVCFKNFRTASCTATLLGPQSLLGRNAFVQPPCHRVAHRATK